VPPANAPAVWTAVQRAGESAGLLPAGLAARDTLRLEAGMPLHGHEMSADMSPIQAGLDWVVSADKPGDFVGRAALTEIAATGTPTVLVGLAGTGRRAARNGYPVLTPDGTAIGEVTSGALSPTLGYPIAMAYVPREHAAPGTELAVDIRGTALPMTVVTMPFYTRPKPTA
jgi:aminomethyltransferase